MSPHETTASVSSDARRVTSGELPPVTRPLSPATSPSGSPRETIRFTTSPRDIRLTGRSLTGNIPEQLRASERTGYERGLIDGEKLLSNQLLRQRQELSELLNGAIAGLQHAVPQVIQQSEDAMIALAFEIATKLVAEMPITRELVAASVREALLQVEDTTEFTVLLNSADLELLGADPAKILNAEVTGHKMRFTASHEVTRGGCVVQTRFGIIDTRRETKAARLAETLGVEINASVASDERRVPSGELPVIHLPSPISHLPSPT